MKFRRITSAVLSLIFVLSVLSGCKPDSSGEESTSYTVNVTDTSSDGETTGSEAAGTTTGTADTSGGESTPGTTDDKDTTQNGATTDEPGTTVGSDTTEPSKDTADASDIIFKQVYGTGENNDTPVRYGFVQLFNTSDKDIPLYGLALCYTTDALGKYVKLSFAKDAVIHASGSYLIRCGEAKGKDGAAYKTDSEKIRIDYYDASWNQVIDNKEVRFAVTDDSFTLSSAAALSGNKSVYSYYIGTQSANGDINACVGISKQKSAYRAESTKTCAFKLIDYKTASASDLADSSPMYTGGDKNTWLSATANVVEFSKDSGFYDSAISLSLSALSGYTIYYTVNGKDPRKSGTKYTQPISMGSTAQLSWGYLTKLCTELNGGSNPAVAKQLGARVIKAYATNGKVSTQVVTNTYYIGIDIGKYDVPFLSLSIEPDEFLSKEKGVYNTYRNDLFGEREHKTAYLEMFETDGSCVSSSYIEIAISGNGSTGFGAKSLKVYFKSDADPTVVGNPSKLKYDIFKGKAGDGVTEYKRLLLRNSGNDSSQSHLRDAYMQALCATLDCDYMAYRPSLMFVNGEIWGVYNIRERYSPKYFEEHYGVQKENFVMLESPSPLIDGSWNNPYEVNDGQEGDAQPYYDLMSFVQRNDLSVDANYKWVSDRLDVDNVIDFFVGSMFLCNTDWPGNNIKVWRNKNAKDPSGLDTKWRFVYCDMDMGVGLATTIDTNMFSQATNEGTQAGLLFSRLLKNKDFKAKFIARFYECCDTVFATSVTLPLLDEMSAAIKDIMPLHFNRWPSDGGSVSNWNSEIAEIRAFMINRKAKAIKHMEAFFGIQPSQISVSMNMAASTLYIDGKQITQSGYTQVFSDSVKLGFKVEVKAGYDYLGIKIVGVSGTIKTYTTNNISVNVSEPVTVVIMTRKTGFTTTPAVVTGSRSIFVLDGDGNLYAWGENNLGQNCVLTSDTMTKPVLVATGVKQVVTSMGGTEGDAPLTAILTETGDVYTVGNNSVGQLGRTGESTVLAKANISVKIKELSAGLDHLLALAEDGTLYGVGNNAYGQLGEYRYTDAVYEFTAIAKNVMTAAAGRRHTIFVTTDGKLYALGDNRWSKFSATASETLTTPLYLMDNIKFVSSGQHNCLAIDNGGNLYYFGWRSGSDFAAGSSSGDITKIAEKISKAYIQDEHIVMLGEDGSVCGYGANNYQQISSDGQTKTTPTLIWNGCIAAGAGTYYSAAIKTDGTVIVRGNNKSGVLGNGSVNSGENGENTPLDIIG